MKPKFETFYRTGLIVLLGLFLWSVWTRAAQSTNADPAAAAADTVSTDDASQKPMSTPQWVEKLAEDLPFLKRQLWGNELWKYLFSLIYIFLAFYVSKLLDYLTRVWLKKLAARTQTQFDDVLLDLLNGPVKIVAFVIFLRIGLDVFA